MKIFSKILNKTTKLFLIIWSKINIFKIFNELINLKLYEKELENIIIKNKPDIIYIHEFKALSILRKIYKKNLLLFKDTKFIYDAHEIECFRNPPKNFFIRLIIELIEIKFIKDSKSKIVSVSHGICNYYKNKLKNSKKVFLIKNLPSKISFRNNLDDENYLRVSNIKKLFFNDIQKYDQVKLGIYVGNITLNRGIEETIELVNSYPNVYLAIIGNFSNKNFHDKIKKLNYDRSRIKIFGEVHNELLVNFIKTADFAFVPTLPVTLSYYYSSPNKLHESKAANLPIFAQNLPEHLIELKVNSSHPIGAVSDFFNHINLKHDFEIFLNNLNEFKHNYKFEKNSYFNSPDQVEIYQEILK
jgi:hypothetical protein